MNWKDKFDERFTRKNKETGKFEDGWFILETIRAKDIKDFISSLLEKQKKECPVCGEQGTKKEVLNCINNMIKSCLEKQKKEIKRLAEDHYWDSLTDEKGLVLKHLNGILSALKGKE